MPNTQIDPRQIGPLSLAAAAGEVSGQLPVPNGGTGLATVAADNVLVGAGAGAMVPRTTAQLKTMLGLNFVDNTADLDKPLSTTEIAVLNSVAETIGSSYSSAAISYALGAGTTIPSGIEAANLSSPAGRLALIGTTAAKLVQATTGYYAPNWKAANNGTSGTIAYPTSSFGIETVVTGSRFIEFGVTPVPTPYVHVLIDDRKILTLPDTSSTLVDYNAGTVKIDLGDARPHKVRFMSYNLAIGSVWLQPGGSLFSGPPTDFRVMALGDSHVQGTDKNTGLELGSWFLRFAAGIGAVDPWNAGITGTGPNQTNSGYPNYKTRATQDIVPYAPAVCIVAGWINDKIVGSRTPAQIAADITTVINTIKSGSPNTRIIVGGSIDPSGANGTDYTDIDAAVKSVCATARVEFVSPTTGEVVSATGVVLATETPWITTVNKNLLIGNDNLHPNDLGQAMIARRWLKAWRILNPGYFGPMILRPQASAPFTPGTVFYDSVNQCLTFFNNDSQVAMQIGQESWVRVRNVTGATIANGVAVYINGTDSGLPSIAPARADLVATATPVGLATEPIPSGSTGFVATTGVVNGLNTSTFTAGQLLYLDPTTAGALTTTPPAAPNYRYPVGRVVVVNATTGSVFVAPATAQGDNAVARNTAQVNLNTSVTETDLISGNVGTGDLVAGTTYRITLRGSVQVIATSGILTLRVRLGANAATQTFVMASQGTAAGPVPFLLQVDLTVRTTGASGTYIAQGHGWIGFATRVFLETATATTTTVDTTAVTPVIKATGQFATSNASNKLLVETAVIERVA